MKHSEDKDRKNEAELLADGSVDIIIGGHTITPKRALAVAFSDPYSFHTVGLLVNDANRDKFSDLYSIQTMATLNLGMRKSKYYQDMVKEYLPNAKGKHFELNWLQDTNSPPGSGTYPRLKVDKDDDIFRKDYKWIKETSLREDLKADLTEWFKSIGSDQ